MQVIKVSNVEISPNTAAIYQALEKPADAKAVHAASASGAEALGIKN